MIEEILALHYLAWLTVHGEHFWMLVVALAMLAGIVVVWIGPRLRVRRPPRHRLHHASGKGSDNN
jgi:hypothetical protein